MLSVYTRHYPPCRQTDANYRRCRCPKWINGTLATGKFIRESAQTRSWETAERKARLMEIDADPMRKAPPEPNWRITIEQAVGDFLRDEEARKLQKTSTCQSKTLLEKQLLTWAREQSLTFLDEMTTAKLREFRAWWNNGALTTQKKHHRLNGFFDFCIENDWLLRNPAKKMKSVQVTQEPTDYFTPAEFVKIVDATYAYGEWKGGRDFEHRSLRLRALILLMRWSGLSMNRSTESRVKQDIAAMHNFMVKMPAQTRLSAKGLLDRFQVPAETQEQIKERFPKTKSFDETFTFVPDEFAKFVNMRTIELDNGALLTAPTDRFDQVFTREPIAGTNNDVVRFSTEGSIIDQRYRKVKP
jgi:hypothetical protein